MKPALILAALALSGCATTKYVSRSCITPQQLTEIEAQAPPKVRSQLNGNAQHDLNIVAANLVRRLAYEDLLLGTLKVCAAG